MSYDPDRFKEFMFIHKNDHFFCEIQKTVLILLSSFLHWKYIALFLQIQLAFLGGNIVTFFHNPETGFI